MFKSIYITRFFSGVLLIVFTLSITPKKFLHTVFAKHIDNGGETNNNNPYHLNTSGYNCATDNLVAESAFVNDQNIFPFPLFTLFSDYIQKENSFSSVYVVYPLLRGPPVNI